MKLLQHVTIYINHLVERRRTVRLCVGFVICVYKTQQTYQKKTFRMSSHQTGSEISFYSSARAIVNAPSPSKRITLH